MYKKFKSIICSALILCLLIGFGIFLPTKASADTTISKILTTVSSTPVALVDPALITVATSTDGLSITGAGWFDANGKAAVGAFNAETYRLEIHLAAENGYTIDQGVAAYLNNSAVAVSVGADGKSAVISREYTAAIWAPTIYKHPGGETVEEGGWASFVVSGSYARDYQWMLVNPSETDFVMISALKSRFPEMDSSGNGSTKLLLYHIPYELNGWKVVCNFIGAGDNNMVRSQGAILTVMPDPSRPVSSPEPVSETDSSAASPSSEEVSSDAAESDANTEEIDSASSTGEPGSEELNESGPSSSENQQTSSTEHEHVFSDVWNYNDTMHWHDCLECGEHSEEQNHLLHWNILEDATTKKSGLEEGICEICGYRTSREIEKLEKPPLPSPSARMGVLISLMPIVLILVAAHLSRTAKQRKR